MFLGLSAAFAGRWLEHVGPRRTMFTAACCFGGDFLISALGVYFHQIALLYLGYGVIGGIGLGLGYVSPVSTLIRWFPDRRGVATGVAIVRLRRRRDDCGAAVRRADEPLQAARPASAWPRRLSCSASCISFRCRSAR